MESSPRYLTKSRFKLACECGTKLFYVGKKDEYADQSAEDPFLQELAKGGYQVGELAKYYAAENARDITVKEINHETAVEETKKRIDRGDRHIAEAAVLHDNLFIRVDILEIDRCAKTINVFEVKSKSWESGERFFVFKRGTREITGLNGDWKSYLYDAAFQKYVVSKAFPDFKVKVFLTLVNKGSIATVDGLNQKFRVKKIGGKIYEVTTSPELTRSDLGESVLKSIPVDDAIDHIWTKGIDSLAFPGYTFEKFVNALSENYRENRKIKTPISKECKKCQFRMKPGDKAALKSGLKECWLEQLGIAENEFEQPLVIELWGGKSGSVSIVQNMIDKEKYFLDQVKREDIDVGIPEVPEGELSAKQRRWEQVRRAKNGENGFYLDREGLKAEMNTWRWPLHFIDFETSSPALPFMKGGHPYEGVAFQYSHHLVGKNAGNGYRIEHKSQFLNTDQGINPNLDFIRNLKKDLSADEGTIFKYHQHENTYLRKIYDQLKTEKYAGNHDRDELLLFIDSITENKKEKRRGARNMIDLWELVVRFYYSSYTRGSNSLKQVLPAAIHDSPFLKSKYSRPVCGKSGEVSSLNFDSKTWIEEASGNDPYKTLPRVFEDYSREELDELFSDMEEVADGGAAMMAYAKLQFFETPEDQRQSIRESLFKYCELDTLAMVMLWEFWNDQVKGRR